MDFRVTHEHDDQENHSSSDCESLLDIDEMICCVPIIQKPLKRKNFLEVQNNGPPAAAPTKLKPKKRRVVVAEKGENEVGPEPQQHPLYIDLILEGVLRYLCVKDLKSCRLVSKQWRDHGTKYLRRRHAPIRFGVLGGEVDELSNFLVDVEKTASFPFARFQIDSHSNSAHIPSFFQHYGSQLTHLILCYQAQGPYTLTSDHLQLIMREIGNVEDLELSCLPRHLTDKPLFRTGRAIDEERKLSRLRTFRFDEDYEMCYSVGFLQQLFYISPNCRRVELKMMYDPVTISRFFTSMKIVALAQLEIQHLHLGEPQVELFSQIGLQLQELKLENVELVDEARCLRRLLENQSSTLETLYLCVVLVGGTSPLQPQNIPRMNKLTHLSLYFPLNFNKRRLEDDGSRTHHHHQFPLRHQNLTQNPFPNLKTLRTTSDVYCSVFPTSTTTNTCYYASVENLTIKIRECDERSLVESIARIFPRLKQLWIVLSAADSGNALSALFQSMQNLDELHIEYFGFGNINCFLTGIHELTSGKETKWGKWHATNSTSQQHSTSSIRNMKKLRKLHISSINSKMTELSVHFGFLHIPRLSNLTLSNLNIDSSCVAQLEARHDTVSILNIGQPTYSN